MHLIDNPFYLTFLLLPPILLIYQKRGLNYSPISPLFLFCLVGWLCLIFGSDYHHDRSLEKIKLTPNPSEEWVQEWTSDSEQIVLYSFGWLPSTLYFLIWKAFV